MHWLEVSIESPGECAEPLAHIFSKHGEGRVIVEQPGGFNPDEGEGPDPDATVRVVGWLPVDATTKSRLANIDVGIRLVRHLFPLPPLQTREVDDESWKRQTFEPVRVGRRLVIAPPWSAYERRPDDVVIPLEPGIAFGTGHHPTTRMCLSAIERHVRNGDTVLDVGCGTGILSIAALKLGAARAVCLDIDEDAVAAARANLRLADLPDRANVAHGSLPHEFAPSGGFDMAFANISANIVIALAPNLLEALTPDGVLVASGVLDARGAEVEAALRDAGGGIETVGQAGEWMAYEVKKRHRPRGA